VGVYYGLAARRAESHLNAGGFPDEGSANKAKKDADDKARNANILYGVAGAAGAGAGALFFLEGSF